MEKYTNEIRNDYDLGLSLELITERFMASMLADGVKEIGKKTACYKTVCKVVYEYIMERGSIVRCKRNENKQ